jgi:hypothetical protein
MKIYSGYKSTVDTTVEQQNYYTAYIHISTDDKAINRMDTNQFFLPSKTLCNVLIFFPEMYRTPVLEVQGDLVVLLFM